MKFTRVRVSRSAMMFTIIVTFAVIASMMAGALQRDNAVAQGVDWLDSDSVSYLTSSGIPVMVPGWLPNPVSGSTPELYAGDGSYSVYFYAGASFLYVTGVAGGGFPGGSEANLNVELSVNAEVQGWPAIHDIGIPAGTPTPIYDKVMWIADGVMYSVTGNGLDAGSLTLANSSVVLAPPSAAAPPAPAEPDVAAPAQPVSGSQEPASATRPTGSGDSASGSTPRNANVIPADDAADASTEAAASGQTEASTAGEIDDDTISATAAAEPAPVNSSDGTSGAWYTGGLSAGPSDGTDGVNPPFLGGDGTGGPP